MSAREDADYHYQYPQEIAEHELEAAEEFTREMRALLDRLQK